MPYRSPVLLVILLLSISSLAANNGKQGEVPSLGIKHTQEKITLDGVLDEGAWFKGTPAKNFWENFPTDSTQSPVQTEIYMTFDDQNLYIAAKCYSIGKDYVISSLRRDFRAGGSDNITFLIDPFNDRTNAFVFGMNPYGVQREALISNGGNEREDFDESWDNKWNGVSKIHDGYWVSEIAIPFSTLRFKEGLREWKFNSYRFDTQSNTRSTWHRIPQNQIIMSLAYMGNMIFEEAPKKPGASIAIIPYITGGLSKDFEEETPSKNQSNFGGDAKINITPSLNLDLTINPDFSQVEVDQQVVNLDRFEIFFPERRQFFLENADLFGRFGEERVNPFFSRRIGSASVKYIDEEGEESSTAIQSPILYGARLSGKADENWRVGLLNMQTAQEKDYELPSYNFTVAALQRKVSSRSNIGMIFVNKQALTTDFNRDYYDEYNRVIGLDYNLASSDNSWIGKAYYHQALTEDKDVGTKLATGARLQYLERNFSISWRQSFVGEGFDAQVGFIRRKDYFRIAPEAQWYFYPSKGKLNRHGPGIQVETLWNPGFGRSDHQYEAFWDFSFTNNARMRWTLQNEYTYLFDDFDPSRSDAEPLKGETGYNYTSLRFFYSSDSRKKLSVFFRGNAGEFFNGYSYQAGGRLTYRYQPFGQIAMDFTYTHLDLPTIEKDIWLIGPRIDITFSKEIFLTTFIQYNSQVDNLNINTRFQWRFAPVSDFFLVYTDNYISDNFIVKNRAIVAKLTYWLNL